MTRHRVTAVGEATTLAERKRRAGQRLILGFEGLSPSAELRRFAREVGPAGFILFARNIEEPAQVRELNRELASLVPASHPALLSVDQEGGRVLRVKSTPWPAMRVVGNMNHLPTAAQVARAMSDELRAMGFNLNFAPCADVDSNPQNPVIGDRAFSRSARSCAEHVTTFVQAMQERGLIATVKHFPGHGDTTVDSHLALPIIEKELPELEAVEFVPFQAAVKAGVGMVMTSHVLFPALDEDNPCTMSSRIIPPLLRKRMGFGGVVISDDMEMKAVRGRYPLDLTLERACKATVDLFCMCKELDLQVQAFEVLVRLQEEDPAQDRLSIDSARRLMELRERFLKQAPAAPDLSVVGSPAFKALAHTVLSRGAQA
jgi:beta-N-acetylhexosaminidase